MPILVQYAHIQVLDRGYTYFLEYRYGEVQLRRIPLPRTPVNISSGAIIPLLAASQPAW